MGKLLEAQMSKPRSGRGFESGLYIKPLCMSLYGGGEGIEDVREIREDNSLREVVKMEEIPSSLPRATGSGGRQGGEAWRAWRR